MECNNDSVSSSSSSSSPSSIHPSRSSEMEQPPTKILKLDDQMLEPNDPIKAKLSACLDEFSTAARSGEFVVKTDLCDVDVPTIGLVIETGKLIKFPLQEDEVVMEELAASQFEIMNNEEWSEFEASLLEDILAEFGFVETGSMSVSLQKVIFQKAGSKFPTNLDALLTRPEKEVGNNDDESLPPKSLVQTFAHLVIQLPSHYTGGHFLFRHEGNEKEFDMSTSMTTKAGWTSQYLAFYAHLEQNHAKILSGVRSCLIYNLQIELDPSKSQTLPTVPTLKNIIQSFCQIIQEWKGSHETAKVLPLPCKNEAIDLQVISKFLGPTLRDNGVTLFHGKKDAEPRYSDTGRMELITKLKIVTSVDAQVEEAFANFLQTERYVDNAGLDFDLKRDKRLRYHGNMLLFFLSGDDGDTDVIFENEDWLKYREFWRFRSHLFLIKYKNVGKSSALLHAANALVSMEVDDHYRDDVFPKVEYFENLLHKFLLLEDTHSLVKLVEISRKKSKFMNIFPILVKSGVDWAILKPAWQDFFSISEIQDGEKFMEKFGTFDRQITTLGVSQDKNVQDLNHDTFSEFLEKFKVLQAAKQFTNEDEEITTVVEFFLTAEVLRYNMFPFMTTLLATFVQKAIGAMDWISVSFHPRHFGVMWVRLVTDLYSCTDLLKNWSAGDEEFDEVGLIGLYFEISDEVGADIKGILGDPEKYGVLVKALSRYANLAEGERDSDDEIERGLPKYLVPFATCLEARIEAFLDLEGRDNVANNRENSSRRSEMLNQIRKLLANVRKEVGE